MGKGGGREGGTGGAGGGENTKGAVRTLRPLPPPRVSHQRLVLAVLAVLMEGQHQLIHQLSEGYLLETGEGGGVRGEGERKRGEGERGEE